MPEPPGSPDVPALAWGEGAPVPTPRTEVAAAADGALIHVIGGFVEDGGTVALVETYDPEADRWTSGPDLPEAVNHAMAAGLDGTVYVAGGYRSGLSNPSDRVFALRDGGWEELPRMPEPRAAGGLAAADGRLFVVGGVGRTGLADTTMVYDPEARSWEAAPPLGVPREHLGVTAHGGMVYAVGGRTGGIGTNLGAAEVYDPETGTWEELPPMPSERGGLAAAATEGGLVVAPGGEAEATFHEAEAFDVESGRWLSLPPLPTARHGLGVVALGDVLYVLAGGPTPGLSVSEATEVLDLRGATG